MSPSRERIARARAFLAQYAESPRAKETMDEVGYVAFRFGGISRRQAEALVEAARQQLPGAGTGEPGA